MSKRTYALAAAVLALCGVFAVGVTAGEDDSNPPSQEATQVTEIELDAKEALGILKTSRSETDALPAEYAERLDRRASFGMNPALSRRAIANLTNSVYVIPAREHVCASLTRPDGVTTICPPTDDIAQGKVGAATVTLGTGGVAVYGLVPDGVDVVSVKTDSPGSRDLPTEGNAYYTVVPSSERVRSISYVGPSGAAEFELHDPESALRDP